MALRGLGLPGRPAWTATSGPVLAGNAAEALLAGGRTAEAAALIDPLTTGPPDRDHWLVHEARAEIDLLRGEIDAAAGGGSRSSVTDHIGNIDYGRESRSGPRSWRRGRGGPTMPWRRSGGRSPCSRPRI